MNRHRLQAWASASKAFTASHVYKLNVTTGSKTCATNVTNSKIVDFAQYQYYDRRGYITDSSNLPGIRSVLKTVAPSSLSSAKMQYKCQPMWSIFFIDVLTGIFT